MPKCQWMERALCPSREFLSPLDRIKIFVSIFAGIRVPLILVVLSLKVRVKTAIIGVDDNTVFMARYERNFFLPYIFFLFFFQSRV